MNWSKPEVIDLSSVAAKAIQAVIEFDAVEYDTQQQRYISSEVVIDDFGREFLVSRFPSEGVLEICELVEE